MRALEINPESEDANLNLGLALFQLNQLEDSLGYFDKALTTNPQCLPALNLRGCALAQLERHTEALADFDKAIGLAPDDAGVLANLGNVLTQMERFEEALGTFEKALHNNPENTAAHVGKSNILLKLHRPADAMASADIALAINPNLFEALNNRGNALLALERPADALANYARALVIKPDYAEALFNRGNAFLHLNQDKDALASFDRALSVKPDYPEALSNRGDALTRLGRYEEALASAERALAVKPDYPEAHYSRGNTLSDTGRFQDALESYERAVRIRPDYAEALANLGMALQNLRRYDDAIDAYARALAIKPDFAEAQLNESMCRLAVGHFEQGWKQYEWRWQTEEHKEKPDFRQPLWDGSFVDGVLLAWGEQGLGDQLLHAGMLDELRQRARRLVVQVEPRLVELFRRSFHGIEVVPHGEALPTGRVNMQIPLGSIGQYFRRGWSDFPKRKTGYLVADKARTAGLRERLTGDGRRLVGLSWVSKVKRHGEKKSARLLDFEPVLKLAGVRFVDLQYGDTSEERSAVAKATGVEVERVGDVDNTQDIDGLAALIGACDAVVTVSNTTAHIAGALGKPVYILLPFSQGTPWYWHVNRDDSPWYPAAKLFRQTRIGDWDSVVAQVAIGLKRGRKR